MEPVPHDFTKPTRLATDWHARLLAWQRSAVTLANKAWAKQLAPVPEASVQHVEVAYARAELSRFTEQTMAYRITIGERLTSLLAAPRVLMLNLVGTLLGETTPAADRELTLIEEKLADYFLIHHWLAFFREAWPGPAPLGWVLQERDADATRCRTFSADDVLVVSSWRLHGAWGDVDGVWCFPKKGLLDALSGQTQTEALPEPHVAARRDVLVQRLPLNVQVVVGSAELPLAELSSLQVGDVVMLDQRVEDGMLARIGSLDLYRGHVGRVGSSKAFRIDTPVKK